METGAGDLDPPLHGYYDLICSRNVLEYIPDLDGAFRGMASVLVRGGLDGSPVPRPISYLTNRTSASRLSRSTRGRLGPLRAVDSLRASGEEVNFITTQVRQLANKHGLNGAL
jgi:hypothetical protein